MRSLRWMGVLVASLIMLSGCSVGRSVVDPVPPASLSDGKLVSGRYSTQQGTTRFQHEFHFHPDGRVTEILTVEGTHKFADFWRERFQRITSSGQGYTFSKEEGDNRMVGRFKKIFPSLEALNEGGTVQVQLLDGPLFRSVSFKSETGNFDPDTMVGFYGAHEQATAEDWVDFLRGAVTVGYVVKDEMSGTTYNWDKTAGEIGSGIPVLIQAKQWHSTAFYGAGVVAVFLSFVVYMGLFGRRHWEPKEE